MEREREEREREASPPGFRYPEGISPAVPARESPQLAFAARKIVIRRVYPRAEALRRPRAHATAVDAGPYSVISFKDS